MSKHYFEYMDYNEHRKSLDVEDFIAWRLLTKELSVSAYYVQKHFLTQCFSTFLMLLMLQ